MSYDSADEQKIVHYIIEQEGGYVDSPHDLGGETCFGISSRWHPEAWRDGPPSREAAREIWLNRYVVPWGLKQFPHEVALKLSDYLCPRNKPQEAMACLQRALNAVAKSLLLEVPLLVDDGIPGTRTMTALHAIWDRPDGGTGQRALLAALRSEIAGQWRLYVAENPSQTPNLRGWVNRAMS